jgi:phage baseplate assembly protein W
MSEGSGKKASGEDNITSDWKFNGDLRNGRVRCHGAGDLVRGMNRDWARVSGIDAIIQKLQLYFAIPKGELLNEPTIGCCLHNKLFDKVTETTCIDISMEMEYELKDQIPELGLQRVIASMSTTKDAVNLQIMGFYTWILLVSRSDLLDINFIDVFGGVL